MHSSDDYPATFCLIALGGNLGHVAETFRSACAELAQSAGVTVQRVSSFYRFPAVGGNAGEVFLNAAAVLSSTLSAGELLEVLLAVEASHGRQRSLRWGPRTLDLDLILFGDLIVDSPQLSVPHPGCWYRRFVLDPVTEIAGRAVHPQWGLSFTELRRRLLVRPLPVALLSSDRTACEELAAALPAEFPQVEFLPTEDASAAVLNIRLNLPDETVPEHRDLPVRETGEGKPPAAMPTVEISGKRDEALPAVRDVLQAALGEGAREG